MMKTASFTRRFHFIIPGLSILLVIFLTTGCVSHVKTLRDAKDQFNTAVSLENQLRFDSEPQDSLRLSWQISDSYQMAVKMLTDLINSKKKDLLKDDLLGSAYTVKAYAEWRLGDFEAALKTLEEVKGHPDIRLWQCDQALIHALPGLIKNDQAFSHMKSKDYPYPDIKRLLKDGLDDIDQGLRTIQNDRNLRLYLTLTELVLLKNWMDLSGNPGEYVKEIPADYVFEVEHESYCNAANPIWNQFIEEIDRLRQEDANALKTNWGRNLSMPSGCEQ
jgi:hypothetical protein